MVQVVTNIIASFISFLTEVEQQNNVVKKFKGQFEKTGQGQRNDDNHNNTIAT